MSNPVPEPAPPDYEGVWIGTVLPALLSDNRAVLPAPARDARVAVLLILDGLGWDAVRRHADVLPNLTAMEGGPIAAAVPTTTSAGLTSISTGLPPAQHGIVGYRMRVGGVILNVLQWRAKDGQPPDPQRVQSEAPFGGRPVPLVTRAEFRGTGFTEAHLRGGRLVGWRTTAVLVEHCRRLIEAGESLVYAYYDGIDKVAHEHGLRDGFFAAEVHDTDRLVGELLDVLPEDCALVVAADHGQVHVGPEGMVDLAPLDGMVSAYTGEARFRGLHAQTGAARELRSAATEMFGDRAWVFSRDELFDGGWLGPDASGSVRGRLGDVVLAAHAPVGFIAPCYPQERELVSCHGSMTSEELLVPLLAARGRHGH